MRNEKTWTIYEPRLPNLVTGVIFTVMFGLFAIVFLRVGGFVWLSVLMGCISVASIALCGYRRSALLDPSNSEMTVQHEVFSWKRGKPIPLTKLKGVVIKQALTQHSIVYRVSLVGLRRPIVLQRISTLDEARRLQSDIASFLDLPASNDAVYQTPSTCLLNIWEY